MFPDTCSVGMTKECARNLPPNRKKGYQPKETAKRIVGSMRPQLTRDEINQAIKELTSLVFQRLDEKGWGAYSSGHEALGILQEEKRELEDAIRENDSAQVSDELLDIAVGTLIGKASIDSRKTGF